VARKNSVHMRLRQSLLFSWLGLCILAGIQQSVALRGNLGKLQRRCLRPRASSCDALTAARAYRRVPGPLTVFGRYLQVDCCRMGLHHTGQLWLTS
jgi:hypothetical protein